MSEAGKSTYHQGAGRDPAPGPVPRGRLVLVDVDLAGVVLGDHGGVVAADGAESVQIFDHVVVALRD
jgi:hypothetical protein